MDGFYSPHQQQHQQQQQQQRMQQNQPNHMQHSMNDPSYFPGGDSLDDIVRDNQDKLYRRQSMPQAFANHMGQFQMPQHQEQHHQGQRRMSAVGNGDIMTFGTDNGDLNSYQFNQPMGAGFPTINTSIGMDQMGNYMTADPNDYSAISPDMMSSMMPNIPSTEHASGFC
jgi:hypothetical protein